MTALAKPDHLIVGIDPGPTTGVCGLRYSAAGQLIGGPVTVQCSINVAMVVLRAVINSCSRNAHGRIMPVRIAVENFVVGSRASRLTSPQGAKATRELIEAIRGLADDDISVITRTAVQVKPWATDERISAAGLYQCTRGMGHARDAGRHALFAACCDLRVPDPMAKHVKKVTTA